MTQRDVKQLHINVMYIEYSIIILKCFITIIIVTVIKQFTNQFDLVGAQICPIASATEHYQHTAVVRQHMLVVHQHTLVVEAQIKEKELILYWFIEPRLFNTYRQT